MAKTLEVQLPDRLAQLVEEIVREGWFTSEAELTRRAVSDFVERRRFQLQERFQLDDIEWAAGLKGTKT
jgi:Arc/MetJ-type ribon-helix-helix transcriptional regulator